MSGSISRRKTRKIWVGSVPVGGDAPVSVQSMTKTNSLDVKATLDQIRRLEEAGCDIVRVAVPSEEAVETLRIYVREAKMPIIADIHFNYELAVKSLEAGASCVRINPGNIGGKEKVKEVVKVAKSLGSAIRIGVNAGSLEKAVLRKYGHPVPQALAESALYWAHFLEDLGFFNFKVSIKSSDVLSTIEAYRLFSEESDAPLHIGITEAGFGTYGIVKSSVGIGALLLEGIGDTIRVSLTGDPVSEVEVGLAILKALGLRKGPEVISCPTCSRRKIDVEGLAAEVSRALKGVDKNIKVAVMGCEVNGPGEAREADCGIAGGKTYSLIFRRGVVIKKVKNEEALNALLEVIKELEVEDVH